MPVTGSSGDPPGNGQVAVALQLPKLDPVRRVLAWKGRNIPLTLHEYLVLAMLLARPGALVARADLEKAIHGLPAGQSGNSIEVHVHKLRRKLGRDFIRTVRGKGYRVDPHGP